MKNKKLDEYKISESTKKILALRDKISEIEQKIEQEVELLHQGTGIILQTTDDVYNELHSTDCAIVTLIAEIAKQRLLCGLTEL